MCAAADCSCQGIALLSAAVSCRCAGQSCHLWPFSRHSVQRLTGQLSDSWPGPWQYLQQHRGNKCLQAVQHRRCASSAVQVASGAMMLPAAAQGQGDGHRDERLASACSSTATQHEDRQPHAAKHNLAAGSPTHLQYPGQSASVCPYHWQKRHCCRGQSAEWWPHRRHAAH
jgi:hypothetical protein